MKRTINERKIYERDSRERERERYTREIHERDSRERERERFMRERDS